MRLRDAVLGLLLLIIMMSGVMPRNELVGLIYDRDALAGGQWWRLITAHWVHFGMWHGLFNALGLWLVYFIYRNERMQVWLLLFVVSAISVTAGLWFFSPTIYWYGGFSGVLHGLWLAFAIRSARLVDLVVAAALVFKVCFEQSPWYAELGGSVWVDVPVVTEAHLYGAIGGIIGVFGLWLLSQRQNIRNVLR